MLKNSFALRYLLSVSILNRAKENIGKSSIFLFEIIFAIVGNFVSLFSFIQNHFSIENAFYLLFIYLDSFIHIELSFIIHLYLIFAFQ